MKQFIILVLTIGLGLVNAKAEEQRPLFIINSSDVASWSEVQNIDNEKIESITVYKDAESLRMFSHLGDISNGVIDITLKDEDGPVLLDAEVMPTFMTGDLTTFQGWVMQNMRYPAEAIEKAIQGMVLVQFVVGVDGYIVKEKTKILSDTDPLLNNEVIRVLNISPRWTPGQNNGKVVPIQFVMPVSFALQISF